MSEFLNSNVPAEISDSIQKTWKTKYRGVDIVIPYAQFNKPNIDQDQVRHYFLLFENDFIVEVYVGKNTLRIVLPNGLENKLSSFIPIPGGWIIGYLKCHYPELLDVYLEKALKQDCESKIDDQGVDNTIVETRKFLQLKLIFTFAVPVNFGHGLEYWITSQNNISVLCPDSTLLDNMGSAGVALGFIQADIKEHRLEYFKLYAASADSPENVQREYITAVMMGLNKL
jgi:hypothetical protein